MNTVLTLNPTILMYGEYASSWLKHVLDLEYTPETAFLLCIMLARKRLICQSVEQILQVRAFVMTQLSPKGSHAVKCKPVERNKEYFAVSIRILEFPNLMNTNIPFVSLYISTCNIRFISHLNVSSGLEKARLSEN